MYGDCFAVQREHRLEQSVVSIKPNKYTPTDFKNLSGFSLFPAEQVLMPTSKPPYEK